MRRCRELSLSLEQIRDMLLLSTAESPSCKAICNVAANHIKEVESKIADLRRLACELRHLRSSCNGKSLAGNAGSSLLLLTAERDRSSLSFIFGALAVVADHKSTCEKTIRVCYYNATISHSRVVRCGDSPLEGSEVSAFRIQTVKHWSR